MNRLRGIRGATRVKVNTKKKILDSTKMLLLKMVKENQVQTDEIASVFITATVDLSAEFPAYAVRELGWKMVPVMCAQEMKVPGSMSGVVRVLMHVNTSVSQARIKHQYLGETRSLRPDLASRRRR